VAAGVPIIDLDVTPPRADRESRPVRLRIAAARPVLVLGVFVLVLAMLGAAAAPARGMVRVLSAGGTAAAAFVLGPDSLYIAQFGESPNSASVVRGFSLADGSLRWAAGVAQNVQNLVLDAGTHVLMGRSGVEAKVVFLDAGSGDELWHLDTPNTSVVDMAGGRVLIRTDVSDAATQLRLADARTGRPVWTRVVGAIAELGPDELSGDTPSRIVAVTVAGRATVLDYRTGSVLSRGDLGVPVSTEVDPSSQNDFGAVYPMGDRIYAVRRSRDRASLAAYSTVPFVRLWQVDGGPVGWVLDCGALVCVADSRTVTAVDPATGATRWIQPGWSTAVRYDATRLFAYDHQDNPGSALIDASTGELELGLGHTFALGGLLLRTDGATAGLSWAGRLDPADGTVHVLGPLDTEASFGCSALGAYLACPTTAGPTGVWRVP
jgi:hypothetical protein